MLRFERFCCCVSNAGVGCQPGCQRDRIYFGPASGAYTNSVAVGNVTNATLTNLKAGAIYYFAATAHDGSGLESAFSNETSYTPPLPPLPQVTGFRAVIASLARFLGFSAG